MKFSQAVTGFLDHCRSRGLAEGTIRAHRSSLKLFGDVIGDIQLKNVTHRHVDQVFLAYGWAPQTRNTRITQYKTFFFWCVGRGLLSQTRNPMFGWRLGKVPEVDRLRIPVQEWGKLFDATEHQLEEAVLALGLFLFLRAGELQQLQLKHVHLADSEIEVYRPKTYEWDTMPISSELDFYLRRHLTWLAQNGISSPESYLLPGRNRDLERDDRNHWIGGTGTLCPTRPVSRPFRYVQRILERAGYETFQQGEHTLRRSGARAYFDQLAGDGYDGALRRVQAMLGHKSSLTTEVYLGLNLDRRARNLALKGKPMFPELQNVTQLRAVHG